MSGRRLVSPTYVKRYPGCMSDGPVRITSSMLDVLEALMDAEGFELHGWAIAKTTKLASPTVYKILERLTEGQLVTARWEERHPDENKPRRRFYSFTATGRAWATALLNERRPWSALHRMRPALGWMDARWSNPC